MALTICLSKSSWIVLAYGLAFFAEFFAPMRNGGFRDTILCSNALAASPLFKMQTDDLALKFRFILS